MDGIIKVNPELLNSTAGELGSQATQLNNLTNNMLQLATGLTSVWTGEASTAYINKFSQLEDDMQKMFRMVQEHSTDLQEMSQAYLNADTRSAEAAQSLSADVIV